MREEYDAVVVGSGAGGGIAAYVLTKRGLKVLLLEAGRDYNPATETPMFQINADAPLNGATTPDRPNGFYDASIVPGEPYTVGDGTSYRWDRSRILGGRTNHWGRLSYRYGPYDFKTHTRDSLGFDWPISYEDLAPYYDRVESLIGVFGAAEGIENSPDSPPGVLLPPPPLRIGETWMKMAVEKRLGIRVVPNHAAILTRPVNGRPACLYATDCGRGCSIGANFQTPTVLLPPARATKRLSVRTLAMVYEIALDKQGRAAGVHYVDTSTNTRHFVHAQAVVLAASTGETTRLLLNSKSPSFPNGLANSSGHVGRNLTDSVVVGVSAPIPALKGLPPYNDDGVSAPHALIPWWGHRDKEAGRLKFATDYIIFSGSTRSMPSVEQFYGLPRERGRPIYGRTLRERLREEFGTTFGMATCGGMIPNSDCYCDIDPSVKDRWGIPALRFHWKWGPQESAQAQHAMQSMTDIIFAMGGAKPNIYNKTTDNLMTSGHELGMARMGASPRDSVLTAFGHTWDVRNIYVVDGACFSSHAGKNPTETIMALAWRASDHLADSFIRKEI